MVYNTKCPYDKGFANAKSYSNAEVYSHNASDGEFAEPNVHVCNKISSTPSSRAITKLFR